MKLQKKDTPLKQDEVISLWLLERANTADEIRTALREWVSFGPE